MFQYKTLSGKSLKNPHFALKRIFKIMMHFSKNTLQINQLKYKVKSRNKNLLNLYLDFKKIYLKF